MRLSKVAWNLKSQLKFRDFGNNMRKHKIHMVRCSGLKQFEWITITLSAYSLENFFCLSSFPHRVFLPLLIDLISIYLFVKRSKEYKQKANDDSPRSMREIRASMNINSNDRVFNFRFEYLNMNISFEFREGPEFHAIQRMCKNWELWSMCKLCCAVAVV